MVLIVGAGMAGLLAGNMLARRSPLIIEKQSGLPNNHSAILRFRTSIVSDVLGIPFRKVTMIKDHLPWKNPVADALAYSIKNTGQARSDRSIIAGMTVAERYIAPHDLIARMAEAVKIDYNCALREQTLVGASPIISTIPMPQLMLLLNYPGLIELKFKSRPAWNYKAKVIDCDAFVSLMVPDPAWDFSRVSITGDELIVEFPGEQAKPHYNRLLDAAALLGLEPQQLKIGDQPQLSGYAKILPIDEDARKAFIHWASVEHNVWSLGRYACWKPGLLLDDLVQDIRLIDRWLDRKNNYSISKRR
jgi:hypothetical protein